eukprot:scaffold5798_cov173-Amphora_coffeaeformis.AAC.1
MMEVNLLALSAFLQSQLDVLVTTAEFFPGKRRNHGASPYPSSLITVEPFCPGGLRRLVINVHSPLIHQVAKALPNHEQAVAVLGAAMVQSGSWPVPMLDLTTIDNNNNQIYWKMARGLIATPHALYAWPVPHDVMKPVSGATAATVVHTPLAVWPRRICAIRYLNDRADPGSTKIPEPVYVAQIWKIRDEALQLEWKRLVPTTRSWLLRSHILSSTTTSPSSSPSSIGIGMEQDLSRIVNPRSALLTFAPSLPVILLANILVHERQVPRHSALAEATDFLLRHDRLFAFSLFFGVPLMDRTCTLSGTLRIAPLAKPPPTPSQMEDFRRRFALDLDPITSKSKCHETLRTIMFERARKLWEMTEDQTLNNKVGNIYVAWSGGIDSTAVLCALLGIDDTDKKQHRQHRIKIILYPESILENPNFYKTF